MIRVFFLLFSRYASKFNEYARQLLSSGPYPVLVPPEGSVYDYCLDFSKGGLVKWDERPAAIQRKTLPSSYTVLTEVQLLIMMFCSRLRCRSFALHAQHALKTSHARYFYIFVCCSRLNSDRDLE